MFRHFLNFKSDPTIGRIEITEPVGFDGSTFTIEQEKGSYNRDITLGSEEIDLEFREGVFEKTSTPIVLTDGTVVDYLTSGYEYLRDSFETNGSESEVEYILEKDGAEFPPGELFFPAAELNELDEFKSKIVQESIRATIKRQNDTEINAFSDKDIDGNAIPPCTTTNVLIQAKPVNQESIMNSEGIQTANMHGLGVINPGFFNYIKNYEKDGIEDTLNWLDPVANANYGSATYPNPPQNFKILRAKNQLTNLKATLTLNMQTTWLPREVNAANARVTGYMSKGLEANEGNFSDFFTMVTSGVEIYNSGPLGPDIGIYNYAINDTFTVDLPDMLPGEVLYFMFVHRAASDDQITSTVFRDCKVRFTATSTAINSVAKGVRLVDLMKHNLRSISPLPLVADLLDVGGLHYDQFAFSGYLIRQNTEKPFNNQNKKLFDTIAKEINCGYQINRDKVIFQRYGGFYRNYESGVFQTAPNKGYTVSMNDNYQIKNLEFRYKKFAQGKEEEENTLDSIHTESQWNLPNRKALNTKKIELDHIRDPFAIEEYRKQAITAKKNKSLTNDDELFVIDVVPVPQNSVEGFSAVLYHIGAGTTLKILSDSSFGWDTAGVTTGPNFKILGGLNIGVYTVVTFDQYSITLTSSGTFPVTGTALTKIEFPLRNVQYKNRTDEGFTLIDNVSSPDNFGGVFYSQHRNILWYYDFLATACKYKPLGEIKNTKYKNNGLLRSQLTSEAVPLVENGTIKVSDIADQKLIDPTIVSISLVASFEEIIALCKSIQDDFGFIRYFTNDGRVGRGYPVQLIYTWTTGLLQCKLEKKFEGDYVLIDSTQLGLRVSGLGYDETLSLDNFEINNIFVQLKDNRQRPLIGPTRFDKIKINGGVFANKYDFSQALQTAITNN